MPSGHEHTPFSIYERLSGLFFLKVSQNKIAMGKKDRCAVLGCNNDHLFPEKYSMKPLGIP